MSGPLAFASAGELASFVTREPDRYTLWSSDGTAAGTRRLAALSDWPTAVEAPGGAYDLSPKEIWWTDGTQPGTRRLATLDADFVHDPVAIRGKLCFFWSRYGELDDRLWCTDGAGIVALPPTNASRPVAAGDFVYFVGSDTEGTYRLFRSDGTVAGTRPLTAFPIGMQQWFSGAAWNGRFYFCGIDDAHGVELWSTDGTDAGTSLLADIEPGPESSFPREITAIGDRIVFSAATAERGLEPWITDGTPAGTRLVADIRPGPASSQPQLFTRVGEDVYFRANDGVHGLEPWRIRLTEIPPAR